MNTINENMIQSKKLLQVIDSIPCLFESRETAFGIDRDSLESLIYDVEHSKSEQTDDVILEELIDFNFTLKEYIELYYKEINNLVFRKYTDVNSVSVIFDTFGSKGFLNTEDGLCLFKDEYELKLNKNEWLVYDSVRFTKVDDEEKLTYDLFLKNVKSLSCFDNI